MIISGGNRFEKCKFSVFIKVTKSLDYQTVVGFNPLLKKTVK